MGIQAVSKRNVTNLMIAKAWKRSVYNCLCALYSAVVLHPINAGIAVKSYNSPRNVAVPLVDFILFSAF